MKGYDRDVRKIIQRLGRQIRRPVGRILKLRGVSVLAVYFFIRLFEHYGLERWDATILVAGLVLVAVFYERK